MVSFCEVGVDNQYRAGGHRRLNLTNIGEKDKTMDEIAVNWFKFAFILTGENESVQF